MSWGFRRFGLRLLGPMHLLKLQRPACVLHVGLPLVDEKQRGKAFAQLVFLLFPFPSAQDHRMETPTFRVSLPILFLLSENITSARVWGDSS